MFVLIVLIWEVGRRSNLPPVLLTTCCPEEDHRHPGSFRAGVQRMNPWSWRDHTTKEVLTSFLYWEHTTQHTQWLEGSMTHKVVYLVVFIILDKGRKITQLSSQLIWLLKERCVRDPHRWANAHLHSLKHSRWSWILKSQQQQKVFIFSLLIWVTLCSNITS